MAHVLAQYAASLDEACFWIEEVPTFLASSVLKDIVSMN